MLSTIFSLPEFIALILFCAAMSFSPGPNTMLTTAIASNQGLRYAMPFAFAVPVGWLLMMIACGLGIGTLVTQAPALRWLIKLFGCIYLIWLAFKLSQNNHLKEINPIQLNMNFPKGVVIQFLNIKAWLLTVTITSVWVINAEGQPSSNPEQRLILSCIIVMLFAFISNMSYAITGAIFRNWLMGGVNPGQRLLIFNRILASILAATAIWTLFV